MLYKPNTLLLVVVQKNINALFEKLKETSGSLLADPGEISIDRKPILDELSMYIAAKLVSNKEVALVFICTHNSRRSHFAQIWAQAAANYFHIEGVKTYSGGTHKTAFHRSAIKALKKVGFKLTMVKEGKNPKYKVRFGKKTDHLISFSKKYNHKKNPSEDFAAILTCNDADDACPSIHGSNYRTSLTYEDPKIYDGTAEEEIAYLASCRQIGKEMLYVFRKVDILNAY